MINTVILCKFNGELDIARFRRWLELRDDTLTDPLGTGVYMVCGGPQAVEVLRRFRLEDSSRFPYQALISFKADEINVDQEYGDEDQLRIARDFVKMVVDETGCEVLDEYGTSWTERVRREGVGVLYPAALT